MTKTDKQTLKAVARQEDAGLRYKALDEAIRISSGNQAKDVVRDANIFYDFLRGRK